MFFFSVIIPTYNREQLIQETIESILEQTYQHFEIIVVDDGSTDNSRQTIERKYVKDERVRYYYKENEERGAARNYGIQQAKGDYIVIFDSDDLMHRDYLSIIHKRLSQADGYSINFVATKYQLKEDTGRILPGGSTYLKEGFYNYTVLLRGNCFGCMYAFKKNNPQLKLFPYDRRYSTLEDWIFIFDNLRYDKIYLIDQIAISVRHNENRSTANNQRVITTRNIATEWILENVSLTSNEQRELLAWSHYYCGIHEYLDNNRIDAIKESFAAIRLGGMKIKLILLLTKSIIGRKLIRYFR